MTEYLLRHDPSTCYGCRACEHICPKGAISMAPDPEGFLYPVLREADCIRCGRCADVCPYDKTTPDLQPRQTYAAQYKKRDALRVSSSGGMFSAAADYILSRGGAVAGCVFDEGFTAVHVVSKAPDIIAKMRGSKYVQSDVGTVYPQFQRLLEAKTPVLFTGTPCQVDGLKRYLNKEYGSLFTVDLICHGVPSPALFKQYLESLRQKSGTISDIRFRDKPRNGWRSQGSVTAVRGGKAKTRSISPFNDSYYQYYYLRNCVSRQSCYTCKYSSSKRVGDITIGDYWNINEIKPELDVKDGFSAVLINSRQGQRLFEAIRSELNVFETDLSAAVAGNGNLSKPCDMPAARKNIYSRIREQGYDAVAAQDCRYSHVIPFLKRHTPKFIKKLLKKIKR